MSPTPLHPTIDRLFVSCLVVTFLTIIACDDDGPAAPVSSAGSGEVSAAKDYLDRAERFGFSGTVLIAHGNQILLHQAYGMDGCWSDRPLTTERAFFVASLTKPLTAAAVLLLEDSGQLSLRDSLGHYFRDAPAGTSGITLRQLLTQRSGLGRPRARPDTGWTRAAYLRAVLRAPLSAAPGESYRYANANYALLAEVIERVSGRSYSEFLRARIFEPLGMEYSGTVTEGRRWEGERLAHACAGDLEQGDALLSHRSRPVDHLLGSVGVVTTAGDLYRFIHGLATSELLPRMVVKQMFSDSSSQYGYGFSIGGTRFDPLVWHTGQLLPEGWNAQLRHYPEQRLTLIVLSGQHRGAPLGWTVARSLDRIFQGGEVDFPAAVAEQGGGTGDEYRTSNGEATDIAGSRYVSDGGEVFAVTRRGERLALLPRGQAAVNFVLGIEKERVNSLTAATSGTARILYGLARDSVVPVTRNLTDDPEERWAPSLRETATWLDSRFGKLRQHEVLHAVPAGFGEYAAVAFARLYYPDDTVTVRLYWVDGRFAGMSDSGAFLGETESVPIEPSALPMAPRPGGGWTAQIVGQTEPIVVKVRSKGGCRRLQLWTRWSNRVTVAEKDRPNCMARTTDSDGGVPVQ